MASYDVLREIVSCGCDLVIGTSIDYDVIRELAALAKKTGSKLTVSTGMDYDLVRELARTYGKSIRFVDGLSDFKKDG